MVVFASLPLPQPAPYFLSRALEDENRRLERIVADQALRIDTLKIASLGRLLTPVQKRRVVQAAWEQPNIGERQACR
jgi:hypothetical protein